MKDEEQNTVPTKGTMVLITVSVLAAQAAWSRQSGTRSTRLASLPGTDTENFHALMHSPFKSMGLFENGILCFCVLLLAFQSLNLPTWLVSHFNHWRADYDTFVLGDISPVFWERPQSRRWCMLPGAGPWCSLLKSTPLIINLPKPLSYPHLHLVLQACI